MQLQLDERPDHNSLRYFSQCLLTEAETLSLLQTAPLTTSTVTTEAESRVIRRHLPVPPETKTKTGATVDKPCKKPVSLVDGYIPGRGWKTNCGGRDHRKQDCKVKNTTARSKVSPLRAQGEDVAMQAQLGHMHHKFNIYCYGWKSW